MDLCKEMCLARLSEQQECIARERRCRHYKWKSTEGEMLSLVGPIGPVNHSPMRPYSVIWASSFWSGTKFRPGKIKEEGREGGDGGLQWHLPVPRCEGATLWLQPRVCVHPVCYLQAPELVCWPISPLWFSSEYQETHFFWTTSPQLMGLRTSLAWGVMSVEETTQSQTK